MLVPVSVALGAWRHRSTSWSSLVLTFAGVDDYHPHYSSWVVGDGAAVSYRAVSAVVTPDWILIRYPTDFSRFVLHIPVTRHLGGHEVDGIVKHARRLSPSSSVASLVVPHASGYVMKLFLYYIAFSIL